MKQSYIPSIGSAMVVGTKKKEKLYEIIFGKMNKIAKI